VSLWCSFTQASFRFSNVFVFAVPTWDFIGDASTFASRAVSFPGEDCTKFNYTFENSSYTMSFQNPF